MILVYVTSSNIFVVSYNTIFIKLQTHFALESVMLRYLPMILLSSLSSLITVTRQLFANMTCMIPPMIPPLWLVLLILPPLQVQIHPHMDKWKTSNLERREYYQVTFFSYGPIKGMISAIIACGDNLNNLPCDTVCETTECRCVYNLSWRSKQIYLCGLQVSDCSSQTCETTVSEEPGT